MAVNENIMVRLTANISDYSAKMQKASADTNKLATTIVQPTNRVKQFERAATTAGMAIGAMGVAVGVNAVRMFADFDEAMSAVRANTGAAGDEMDALKNAALDAGATTVYNATESAEAINELAKAGMSTADILSGGLAGALDLAASDGMEVAQAAEYMSSALSMFHLEGSRAVDVADALAAGAGKALGEVSDFGEALNNCGAQAYAFGMSMEETVGVLGLFAENGLVGAEAGTQLNSMLMKLANPTDNARAVMDELGISAYNASGEFVGMANFAGQLQQAEANLTEEQRNQANATMFGSYAIRAANYLFQAGADDVRAWTGAVSDSGYASELAAQKTDNLKGDLEQLSGAMETAFIKIGEGANDTLRDMVQGVTGVVEAFASLDPEIQQMIVQGALAVGAIAGLHKVFGDLKNSSSEAGQQLGLLLDPVQRLQSAAPQVKTGFDMLGTAMTTAARGGELMENGLTRSQTAMEGVGNIAGGVIDLLGGPWGIALTIAGIALSNYAKKVQESKARVEEFEAAIKSGSDVNEKLVDSIQSIDYGWYDRMGSGVSNLADNLKSAGIEMSDFAMAVQGSQPYLDKVNEQIKELYWSNGGRGQEAERARLLSSDLKMLASDFQKATDESAEATAAVEAMDAASGNAADSTNVLADGIDNSADSASNLAGEIDGLIQSLFTLESSVLSSAESQVALDKSIRETVEDLTAQGAVLDENGNYLEGMQEKGENAKNSLYDLASQAQSTATKILEEGQATNDMENATKSAGDELQRAGDAFVEAAVAAGMSEQAARRQAEKFGLTRAKADELARSMDTLERKQLTEKGFVVSDNGTIREARLGLDALDKITLAPKTLTIHQIVQTQMERIQEGKSPAIFGSGSANGGLIDGHGGPRADNKLMPVSGGEYVVNALATSKNRAVLDAINFAGAIIPGYANGGYVPSVQATPAAMYGSASSQLPASVQYVQNINQRMYSTGDPYVQAGLAAARVRSDTRALLAVRGGGL